MHLNGAMRFINHAKTWKQKYSSKAKSLHRIYFYLRTIHYSTALSEEQVQRSAYEADDIQMYFDGHELHDDEAFADNTSHLTSGSFEHVYGVPGQLLVLMDRVSRLINDLSQARTNVGGVSIPEHLVERCDSLEQDLMTWSPSSTLVECHEERSQDGLLDIMRKTTSAFHNALIVYFAQHIRLLSYRYLRPYVADVLNCVEAIERVKADTNTLAAPLFWPVFIAASEAFDSDLQQRFRTWYNHVERYGLAAVRTGTSVLNEVWANGPRNKSCSTTCCWRDVTERRGVRLMLS